MLLQLSLTLMCVLCCPVYYLKATFGVGTSYALLEIPVSVTGYGRCLSFEYQISSPRIELIIYQSKTGNSKFSRMQSLKYTNQKNIGRWNYHKRTLSSDARAIRLVAKKIGVTTNVEYVLVDVISIDPCFEFGNVPLNILSICR